MNKVPAIPYYAVVKQFAIANGLKFWTVKQQREAMIAYESFVQKLN
jgi:hypothetical protein